MPTNLIWILIGVALGGTLIAVVTYYLMRYLRGSIKLSMLATSFNPGDTSTGTMELLTRKEISGNKLIVSLIGDKISKTYRDDETETHTNEIHRSEIVIESARIYPAGFNAPYTFEISIPGHDSSAIGDSALGQTLAAASLLLNDRETRYEWRVEARLDAQGVDLAKTQKISINL